MGFMATLRKHAASKDKGVKAKYVRKVATYSEDVDKALEVTITVNTIVLDTTAEGIQQDAQQAGGSIKAGEHGSISYKSDAGDKLAEAVAEVFAADIAGENSEAPKRTRRRTGAADTVPSANGTGEHAPTDGN